MKHSLLHISAVLLLTSPLVSFLRAHDQGATYSEKLTFRLDTTGQEGELSKSIARGKVVYEERCVTCHMAEGKGIPSVFPPVAESDYLMKNREASIRAVKFGQEGEITVNGITYNNVMAAQGLGDTEVADVMNYILNSWGNKGKMVTADEVANVK